MWLINRQGRVRFPTPLTLILGIFYHQLLDLMVFVPVVKTTDVPPSNMTPKMMAGHGPAQQELGQEKQPPVANTSNCSRQSSQFCSKDLNLWCDPITGQCRCHPEYPVRLSPEIPCLKNRSLGELCIHTAECAQTEHASCVASFLFTMKTLSKTPSYKQWFFYNKIHNDDDMSYLLSKMYGRCRCQKGFRAVGPSQCVPAGTETPYRCDHQRDCRSINARCENNRCHCWTGYHYHIQYGLCDKINNLYGKFCAASSDCFRSQSNMECKHSKCICPRNYFFYNDTEIGCQRKESPCPTGKNWNDTSRSCMPDGYFLSSSSSSSASASLSSSSSSSSTLTGMAFCATAIKYFPFLLIIVIIFNLICYIRGKNPPHIPQREVCDLTAIGTMATSRHRYDYHYHLHHTSNILQQGSYSLLSLPDYETIFNNNNNDNNASEDIQKHHHHHHPPHQNNHHHYHHCHEDDDEDEDNDQQHLPTYEEALEALRRLHAADHELLEEQTDNLISNNKT